MPTPSSSDHETHAQPRPLLGLADAVTLIVGIVVGAGIFKAPALVAGMSASAGAMFLAWVLGGAVSLAGALCYAELSTAYAHAGGDYHFLHRAYGRTVAFLFGWARYAVITTGSIALLAFVFGDYLAQVAPLPGLAPAASAALYAGAAVLVLGLLNLHGLRSGSAAQTWLTVAEVGGLLLVALAALRLPGGAAIPAVAAEPVHGSFGLAMVFVLLTYGGWNEAAYLSAEVRDGAVNMVRSLVLTVLIVTGLYLLVTWGYWHGLGMHALASSQAPAAELMRRAFGRGGEQLIALLVAVSALTSINATMIVGARTGYAMGRDWRPLAWLARWDGRRATPTLAMLLQCGAALLLVGLGAALGGGFRAMVEFTAPVFWLFFLLSGISLFVLRRREPGHARPYRVPLFPLLPLLFCASCAYMLWSSLSYVGSQTLGGLNAAWIGVAVLAAGVFLLALLHQDEAFHNPANDEENRR
ncbi:APC family permease [Massilia aerilata]|uniref:APC family permease n=1 Tax=Massilia aerilata TaxID=453817 RepID=A0ABW0RQX8_9BURK